MDTICSEARSRNMAAIHSRGNRSTEKALRARLVQAGISGWRMCVREIEGCPDFVFEQNRFAIFVDGCFWHGCPKCHRRPSSNTDYWTAKLKRNRKRDHLVTRNLRANGWRVLRIWEHELAHTPDRVLVEIQKEALVSLLSTALVETQVHSTPS